MYNATKAKIYSARLLKAIETNLVVGQPYVINKDYEPDVVSYGDRVAVPSGGNVTVGDYTPFEGSSESMDQASDAAQDLVINQRKTFEVGFDDLEEKQSRVGGKLRQHYYKRAGYALAKTADNHLSGVIAAGAATANKIDAATLGGSAGVIALDETQRVLDLLFLAGSLLDQNDAPEAGRYVILPSLATASLKTDDLFTGISDSDIAKNAVANAKVGEAAGFLVLRSNNLTGTNADTKAIFGVSEAATWAEQLDKTEVLRSHDWIGDFYRGLHVYGAKVLIPEWCGSIRLDSRQAAKRN